MSAIDRRNRRRKRFFVKLEFDDTRISEKFLRYLRIRMMTRTGRVQLNKFTPGTEYAHTTVVSVYKTDDWGPDEH